MTDWVRSAPKEARQVRFAVETERLWRLPAPRENIAIALRLRVTNLGRAPISLFVRDSLSPLLSPKHGAPFPVDGGRNATRPAASVLGPIAPGDDIVISRDARIECLGERFRLIGLDGFGGIWYIDKLDAGEYRIALRYVVPDDTLGSGSMPLWRGQVQTNPLTITLR